MTHPAPRGNFCRGRDKKFVSDDSKCIRMFEGGGVNFKIVHKYMIVDVNLNKCLASLEELVWNHLVIV